MWRQQKALNQICNFFFVSENNNWKRKDEFHKKDFFAWWKGIVPEPFASDPKLAKRISALTKFTNVTY